MKTLISLFVLLLVALGSAAQSGTSDGSVFILSIDGIQYELSEGEEMKIDSAGPVISVKRAEFKKFDNEGIAFHYPNNFSYEVEEGFGFKFWSFDGNDYVIMYYVFSEATSLEALVDEMVKQFGRKHCKVEEIKQTLGGRILEGSRINVSIVGQNLTLDMFEINLPDEKTRFLLLQDLVGEDGAPTSEGYNTLGMINESIIYQEDSNEGEGR